MLSVVPQWFVILGSISFVIATFTILFGITYGILSISHKRSK